MTSPIPDAQRAAAARPLPGVQPCKSPDWLTINSDYAAQLAAKADLLKTCAGDVLAVTPEAAAACDELLRHVIALLEHRSGFELGEEHVTTPDGREVFLNGPPLRTLGALLQEDLCILQPGPEGHRLTAALVCFPASWTLAEKIGKPLDAIHGPVASYDAGVQKRVQRLFDGVRPRRPLWRANLLRYEDPALFQPRKEADPRPMDTGRAPYERSERQTIFRLPESGAVVFAIHTSVREAPVAGGSGAPYPSA